MILKHTSPSDPAGLSDLADLFVATEAPEVDPEPNVAIAPQPKSSPSKKGQNK